MNSMTAALSIVAVALAAWLFSGIAIVSVVTLGEAAETFGQLVGPSFGWVWPTMTMLAGTGILLKFGNRVSRVADRNDELWMLALAGTAFLLLVVPFVIRAVGAILAGDQAGAAGLFDPAFSTTLGRALFGFLIGPMVLVGTLVSGAMVLGIPGTALVIAGWTRLRLKRNRR